MNIDLSDHTLFITGGHGGIGKAICDCFRECGSVVIAPTSKELNLTSEQSIVKYMNNLHSNPDLVIHCAGSNKLAGIGDLDMNIVQNVYEINLFSFMRIIQFVIPKMIEKNYGRVIGISSLYGIVARERRIPYSSSKHALSGFIKSLALEVAKHNIMVNGVAPGYVLTPMTYKNMKNFEIEQLKEQIPTGRLQEADEIASLCAYLCSDYNRSITGQIIPVDGGLLCK